MHYTVQRKISILYTKIQRRLAIFPRDIKKIYRKTLWHYDKILLTSECLPRMAERLIWHISTGRISGTRMYFFHSVQKKCWRHHRDIIVSFPLSTKKLTCHHRDINQSNIILIGMSNANLFGLVWLLLIKKKLIKSQHVYDLRHLIANTHSLRIFFSRIHNSLWRLQCNGLVQVHLLCILFQVITLISLISTIHHITQFPEKNSIWMIEGSFHNTHEVQCPDPQHEWCLLLHSFFSYFLISIFIVLLNDSSQI